MRICYAICISIFLFVGCADLGEWNMEEIPPTTGQIGTETANQIADFMTETLNREELVGLEVAICDPSGEIWSFPVGTEDLKRDIALTDGSIMRIGSLTKTYTGAVILKLCQEGQLCLDSTASAYLDGYEKLDRVTIHQLLNHRTGIRDVFEILEIFTSSLFFPDKWWNHKEIVERCLKADLDFDPGTDAAYSNTNFLILGMIAEEVTGMEMAELYRDLPAEMEFVPYTGTPERLVSGYVDRFVTLERWFETKPENTSWATVAYSAGAIATTSEDIAVFSHDLFHGSILEPEYLDAMTTFEDRYGLGIRIYSHSAGEMWGHEGEIVGFQSAMLYDPETGFIYAGITNTTPFDMVEFLGNVRVLVDSGRTV